MVVGIAEAPRELSEFSPEFFTNSPQYMNTKIANFDFCGAIRNELDQWNVQPGNVILLYPLTSTFTFTITMYK